MKNISIILAVFALVFTSVSCEKYDDYDTDRPVIIGFTKGTDNIKVPNNSTREKKVTIFITEAADVDRTFHVSVVADKTEVAAENYSFDADFVMPAGERFFEFVITGIDESLTDEKLGVTLKVDEKDGIISGGTFTALIFK